VLPAHFLPAGFMHLLSRFGMKIFANGTPFGPLVPEFSPGKGPSWYVGGSEWQWNTRRNRDCDGSHRHSHGDLPLSEWHEDTKVAKAVFESEKVQKPSQLANRPTS
jgi:hypothetical protein